VGDQDSYNIPFPICKASTSFIITDDDGCEYSGDDTGHRQQ